MTPKLLTVIHTEEAFDWDAGFNCSNCDVSHLQYLDRVQNIFESFGISPTYAIDSPVVNNPEAVSKIKEIMDNSVPVEIAAHLHPWLCSPKGEIINDFNSFPSNLPVNIERAKILDLTRSIEECFGEKPKAYLAGRYGVRESTYSILKELSYTVDLSPSPGYDFSRAGGPDFTNSKHSAGFQNGILVIPHTTAFVGWATRHGRPAVWSKKLEKVPGFMYFSRFTRGSRLIRLSPEGMTFNDMKNMTIEMMKGGETIFLLSFHSPSVEVGNTPYVGNQQDLERFLDRLRKYCEFFIKKLKGTAVLPQELIGQFAGNHDNL